MDECFCCHNTHRFGLIFKQRLELRLGHVSRFATENARLRTLGIVVSMVAQGHAVSVLSLEFNGYMHGVEAEHFGINERGYSHWIVH